MIKIAAGLLFLYVAFGGRFGWESLQQPAHSRGNYQHGNAYEQYRRQAYSSSYNTNQGYRSTGRNDRYNSHNYDRGYNSHGGYNDYGGTGYYGGGGGISDGTIPSLMIMLGIAYVCHLNGINPIHAMWMMNMAGGGRRRYGGFGGMRRGFGYGGGGIHFGRRRRW